MQTIMIEVPIELKPAIENFVAAANDAAKLAGSGRTFDPKVLERTIQDAANGCEVAALKVALEAGVIDAKHVRIDGKLLFAVGTFEREYMTSAGPIRVMRPLYREVRNGPTFDILAMKFGMVADAWLPGAAAHMAMLLAMGTSREAERAAELLGRVPYSAPSFGRIAHAVGKLYAQHSIEIDQRLIEDYALPVETTGIVVSLDRVSIPVEEPASPEQVRKSKAKRPISRNFRMAYCASVSMVDSEGQTLHTIRYGSMPKIGPVELVEGLASDVMALLAKKKELDVLLVLDGAPELWHLLDGAINRESVGVDVHRLIDLFHLLEKLGSAANAIYGESDMVSRWRFQLLNSHDAALGILRELKSSGRLDEPVHAAITYIENNHDRMDYASARKKGLPVGSGPVEATCKSLVGIRMKRAGARWKEDTGQHIIQLRALLLSDRWEPAMDITLAPLQQQARRVA